MKFFEKVKKFINSLPPRACCPNCGINFAYIRNIKAIWYTEHDGVSICKNCLDHPEKLYPDRIYNNLHKKGWSLTELDLIKQTVINMIPIKELRKQKLQKILKL